MPYLSCDLKEVTLSAEQDSSEDRPTGLVFCLDLDILEARLGQMVGSP